MTRQRNHEDSKRKGASVIAGWRRSAERGSYLGNEQDGYKLHVEIDARGKVKKTIVIDPDRRQVIEMIFRMSLRGKNSGQIARAVNKAGWRTNPPKKDNVPRAWTVQRVLCTLKNPRYAGLSAYKGEILARECWPAYITERQHLRIQAALRHRPSERVRKPEPFLLARLLVCGRCGSTLVASTRYERVDGTWGRTYVCVSERTGCHVDRCDASTIQAEMFEALFVSALPTLLIEESSISKTNP